jgi:uncharacterized protein with von Willebrand factor type A (vWA) domain
MLIRYSRWDGSQDVPDFDADDVLGAMADDVLAEGDPWSALQRLLQRGAPDARGRRLPGLRDLVERLRQRRRERLDRHDLGASLEHVKRQLAEVLRTEREGIERQVAEARERARAGEASRADLGRIEARAARHRERLDRLPADAAGRIRELSRYDFLDPEARRLFQELLESLRQQTLKPFVQGMQEALRGMTRQDRERLREMLRDLNRLLRARAEGEEPDFEAFRTKWGQHFPGVESLDDLIEQLARQTAQLQSLLQSLSPTQRQELEDMMRALLLQDERLEVELRQLGQHLAELGALDELRRRYPFRGADPVTLEEAMRLMEELQGMDALERELREVRDPGDLERVDRAAVEQLLGPEAARELDELRALARKLEEAGYLERDGDRFTLTARAIRKIADRALREVFAALKRDRMGGHGTERRGVGGDRTDETKRYEFGDPFLLDPKETVMNALERGAAGTPVRLSPNDFEVFRTEFRTRAATVVMLDMSRSMLNNGYFLPAKKVALALSALIRGQFPRDALYVVGFSLYARQYAVESLPTLSWSEWEVGTNMHAGLALARQLLGRHKGGNRQILLVTDGEPTAHLEGGVADFSYPPSRRTLEETLREVRRCTRDGITINTFMLERSPWLTAFVEQMARINRGRAFFTSPDRLGEYVLVDYVRSKRRTVA